MTAQSTRRRLVDWYHANRRELPWRATKDPYAIWVSETMLQQTRVETVIPYYERFLERFPDPQSLARADLDDVLGLWAGLGYYSRARNLKAAAEIVCDRHDGRLPADAASLRALPGVGRYTAGAVASIAFAEPEPIVDGNVARVLARLHGIAEDLRSASVQRRLWEEAAALAKGPDPGDLNQALMELGARICTPKAPRCPECPVRRRCKARRAGDAERLPIRSKPKAPRAAEATAALLLRRGRALAVRRPKTGLLGGLWELPGGALAPGEPPEAGLLRALRERLGLAVGRPAPMGVVEHAFTHLRLRLHVFRSDTVAGRVRRAGADAPEAHRWVAPENIGGLPHGALTAKALSLLSSRNG